MARVTTVGIEAQNSAPWLVAMKDCAGATVADNGDIKIDIDSDCYKQVSANPKRSGIVTAIQVQSRVPQGKPSGGCSKCSRAKRNRS